jgi:hypothetical protein
MVNKIVPAHTDIRRLIEVDHYEAHEKRTESAEFRRIKKELHEAGVGCWIGNGRCEGGLEIHHNIIEYSAITEVDINKVRAEHPDFKDVDCKEQMLVLCEKHHRGKGFGIHDMTYPIWQLQKYMTPEALDHFESAVKAEIEAEKAGGNK